MKTHVGVDTESGLVQSVMGASANVEGATQVVHLLHGEQTYVYGDGVEKHHEHQHRPKISSIAARPNSFAKHCKKSLIGRMRQKIEHGKAQKRGKVDYPF